MRDFDPSRAKLDCEPDHISRAKNIGAVDDGIDGERQTSLRDPFRDRQLAGEGALVAGDPVGRRRI